MSEVKNGVVKWFSNTRGFGFVTEKDKQDYFVHFSSIVATGYKSLKEGQFVEFELLETPKGLQAVNVKVIEKAK